VSVETTRVSIELHKLSSNKTNTIRIVQSAFVIFKCDRKRYSSNLLRKKVLFVQEKNCGRVQKKRRIHDIVKQFHCLDQTILQDMIIWDDQKKIK
jgi:hypothetical protein